MIGFFTGIYSSNVHQKICYEDVIGGYYCRFENTRLSSQIHICIHVSFVLVYGLNHPLLGKVSGVKDSQRVQRFTHWRTRYNWDVPGTRNFGGFNDFSHWHALAWWSKLMGRKDRCSDMASNLRHGKQPFEMVWDYQRFILRMWM